MATEIHSYAVWGDEDLALEVVRPEEPTSGPLPAVVFFHGGGWREGSRGEMRPHARALARRGFVGVTADYRLASQERGTTPIHCVDDARLATEWLHANAAHLGIDPARIAIGGGSSGGQMAAAAVTMGAPAAAVVLYAPAVTDDGTLRFGFLGDGSPDYAVDEGFPPTLIVYGSDDAVVLPEAMRFFGEALASTGVRCELVELPGAAHTFYNAASRESFERTVAETDRFLVSVGLR